MQTEMRGMAVFKIVIAALVIVSMVSVSAGQNTYTNSIGMEFVQIPVGEFDMGSNETARFADEGPIHSVKISNTYYMGKYEVTQKQWRDVMGTNPSNFKGDNLPVESVSWGDVQEFVNKLNQNEEANKYRLPSEAEWEYAARAGTTTIYSFGDAESKLGEYAWYSHNSGGKTHEVGQKKPNSWGLYDIHGNAREWVQDTWHKDYNSAPTDGSVLEWTQEEDNSDYKDALIDIDSAWENGGSNSDHVLRGGSWGDSAKGCRSVYRFNVADGRNYGNGFRLLSDSPVGMVQTAQAGEDTILQDSQKMITIGEMWNVGNGFTLSVQAIDFTEKPIQMWIVLSKDGGKLDDKVLSEGDVYNYRFKETQNKEYFITFQVNKIIQADIYHQVQLNHINLGSNVLQLTTSAPTPIVSQTPYIQPTTAPQQDSTNRDFLFGTFLVIIAIGIVVLSLRRSETAPKPPHKPPIKEGSDILDAEHMHFKKTDSVNRRNNMSNKLIYSLIGGVIGLILATILDNVGSMSFSRNMTLLGGIIGLFVSKISLDIFKNEDYQFYGPPLITGVCVGIIVGIIAGENSLGAAMALGFFNIFFTIIVMYFVYLLSNNGKFIPDSINSTFYFFYMLFCAILGALDINVLIPLIETNRYFTFPLFIIPLFAFIGYITGKQSDKKADYEAIINQQYLQTVPGLFDTAKSLSSQASQLFQQKNYPDALQTYENSISHFTQAHKGAKSLNDIDLANSISKNISAIHKNITVCKNAIGVETASKAGIKFENGDFTGAIQTYEKALNYFQDSKLISKTKSNIESCYIKIDAKNVEELSNEATSLLNDTTKINEPFKARDLLKKADLSIEDAVTIARKRNFKDALSQLNTISKNILVQRSIINEQITSGIDVVPSGMHGVETVESGASPKIPTGSGGAEEFGISESDDIKITRGYEVLENKDMRFGILVTNISNYTVNDVDVHIRYDRHQLSLKSKDVISLGNITKDNPKTATYILTPIVACVHNSKISAIVSYTDASDKSHTVQMHPKEAHCISPFLAEKPMTEEQFSQLYDSHTCHKKGIVFKGISPDDVTNFIQESAKNKRFIVKNSLINGIRIIYLSSLAKDKTFYLSTMIIRSENGLTHIGLMACSNNDGGINNFISEILKSLRLHISSVESAREVENIENKSITIINSPGAIASWEGNAMGKDESFNFKSKR